MASFYGYENTKWWWFSLYLTMASLRRNSELWNEYNDLIIAAAEYIDMRTTQNRKRVGINAQDGSK